MFARILRGELPCDKVHEDEHSLAFHDINPLAPVHILVIPKGPYVSWDDFSERASDAEIAGFIRAVGRIARDAGMVVQGYLFVERRQSARVRKVAPSTFSFAAAFRGGRWLVR